MYKQVKSPTEERVNEILNLGYILHSITPVYTQNSSSYGNSGHTDLIYHFIKNKTNIGKVEEEYSKNMLGYDMNFNPFEPPRDEH